MDYLIRCKTCNHTVSQHGPRGCDGEASRCECTIDRDGVLSAIVLGDLVRFGTSSAQPQAKEA
jgi:hypothetical protein